MVLAELWTPNQADMMLINRGAPFAEICLSAEKSTLAMADDVSDKLRQGRTNLEELVRTLPHSALRKLQLTPRGQSSAISGPTPRPAQQLMSNPSGHPVKQLVSLIAPQRSVARSGADISIAAA